MLPEVGSDPRSCTDCGQLEYAGAPLCRACVAKVDAIIDDAWRQFVRDTGIPDATTGAETEAWARLVIEDLAAHDWRVVDAAYDRIPCTECGHALSRGPAHCGECTAAHAYRYGAVETDRPSVPPGNEHAVRVNVSAVRRPEGLSEHELTARRLVLPYLLVGRLPTTAQAQRLAAELRSTPPGGAAAVVARLFRPGDGS
ncbi:hypothetical protein AB0O42_08115 [Streptomyces sp. NPDC089922]|uniref:hypothetical protein n=1 Tax=Streptomyces sp. NPDC089922 TaxID=3155189 RepID=UPI00342E59B7